MKCLYNTTRKYFYSYYGPDLYLKLNTEDTWNARGGVTDDLDKYDDLMMAFVVILM